MSALLRSSGFQAALAFGIGGSALAALAALAGMRLVASIALGVTIVVAVIAGLAAEDAYRGTVLVGLLLVASGAVVSWRWVVPVRVAALCPGAAVMAWSAAPGALIAGWARVLVFTATITAIPATTAFDHELPRLTYPLLALSALGAYSTVPDTEQARALVGALLLVAIVAFVLRVVPEPSGPSAAGALLMWVALVGGVGRAGSVIGAIGCLGVLVLARAARRIDPAILVMVHLALVAFASRVAGRRQSALAAAALLALAALVAASLLFFGRRRTRRERA